LKCLRISFRSFRNIEEECVDFTDGTNVLFGENAQGKSNILEGIYFFARGRSFRGAKEKEMIRFGDRSASLSLDYIKDSDKYPVSLGCEILGEGRKIITKNQAKLTGAKEMIGAFRAVLFCPAHLTLVSGGPALRRSFMDIALSQLHPAYLDSLSKYNRALIQRNSLIKKAQSEGKGSQDSYLWEIYADQLSRFGSDIAARRLDYMRLLSSYIADIFDSMTNGREKPSLTYRSSCIGEMENGDEIRKEGRETLFRSLLDNIDREIIVGSTLYGAHKDDIQVRLNSKEAKTYASQGQQRSLALSMKLGEGEIAKKISGEYPVFLLDDVLSELDLSRRRFVLSNLSDRQLIVTSCEPDIFRSSDSNTKLLHIENGRLV